MKFSISDTNFIPKLLKEVKVFKIKNAVVGVQESESEKLKMIAGVHEHGCDILVTPKMRRYLHSQGLHLKASTETIVIPQRAYMRLTADDSQALEKIKSRVESAIIDMLEGSKNAEYVLTTAGTSLRNSIRERIGKGIAPKLHEFTISRKGSTIPLLNKRVLLNAIKAGIQ